LTSNTPLTLRDEVENPLKGDEDKTLRNTVEDEDTPRI